MDKKYLEVILTMQKERHEVFESINKFNAEMLKVYREHSELFKATEPLRKMMASIKPIQDAMERFKPLMDAHKTITEYVKRRLALAKNVGVFARHGWYLSMWFIDELRMTDIISKLENEPSAFEEQVYALFEKTLIETIQGKLVDEFPKRKAIFERIVERHQSGDYISSVLLAVTQADGMCKDVFFVTKKGKKKPVGFFDLGRDKDTDKRYQELAEVFDIPDTSLFTLLTNQLAAEDRNLHPLHEGNTADMTCLNRHSIVHGESADYATYKNSVQAILVLDFIADLYVMDQTSREYAAEKLVDQ